MSIRGFHLIFITIATLLCVGLSLWVFKFSGMIESAAMYGLGIGAALAATALPVYGYMFRQKLKKHNI